MGKFPHPLPKSLPGECSRAAKTLNKFVKPKSSKKLANPDSWIPNDVLAKSKGLAILKVVKGGFLWSGRIGNGLVIAKSGDGSYSAPSCISIVGVGFGGQVGLSVTYLVFLLMSDAAVKAFSRGGNVTLGSELGVALGPVGRSGEVAGAITGAAMYAYSKSKGLFAGISLEGSIIIERKGTNKKFYGRKISAGEILNPTMTPPPPQAEALYRALYERVGYPRTARNDVPVFGFEDEGMRDFRSRMEVMRIGGGSGSGSSSQSSSVTPPFSPRPLEWRNTERERDGEDDNSRKPTSSASRLNLGSSSASQFNPFVTSPPPPSSQYPTNQQLPPRYSRIISALESEEGLQDDEEDLWK